MYRKPEPGEPRHVGVDLGGGDDCTAIVEFTMRPDGRVHIHHFFSYEGVDDENQHTGGQDF